MKLLILIFIVLGVTFYLSLDNAIKKMGWEKFKEWLKLK